MKLVKKSASKTTTLSEQLNTEALARLKARLTNQYKGLVNDDAVRAACESWCEQNFDPAFFDLTALEGDAVRNPNGTLTILVSYIEGTFSVIGEPPQGEITITTKGKYPKETLKTKKQ